MHQRSPISLTKLLLKNPFHPSNKPPTFSFLFKLLSPISTPKSPLSKTPIIPSKPTSISTHFNYPTTSISHLRSYSDESFNKDKIVDEINLKFAEAREEIEAAMESKETVYFNEEAECARAAVKDVLDMFHGLLGKLSLPEKEALQRSMGLKIEQLKAELQQLDD